MNNILLGMAKPIKQFTKRTALALAVLASLTAFLIVREMQASLEVATLVATIAVLLIGFLLEKTIPFDQEALQQPGETSLDLTSAVMLLGIVDPLIKYAAPVLIVFAYSIIWPSQSFSPLMGVELAEVPFLLQVFAITLVIEFGKYWAHRWHHSNRFLWWLHAMHHSSTRLRTINNFRFHPLNYLINFSLSTFPLMVLGVPSDVLLAYLAITQPVLMLQHANIDLKSGWLNYIFSTNELHRWHHSVQAEQANSNYGSALVIWDQVFKTFRHENRPSTSIQFGLFTSSNHYPSGKSYWGQLASAFTPTCCKT